MTTKNANNDNKNNKNKARSSSLPFEIREQAKRSSPSSATGDEEQQLVSRKKRVEAIISSEKLDAVLTAIGSLKLAATYYDSKGKGKGQKYTISYGRGVGSSKMAYSDRKTIVTIVDAHRVEDVITTIRSASAGSGSSSAGIIIISSVDDILQL
ncbi:MAG TPA: P-II family nitrogen regulator [Nitrososphaeraceae archaeon]|jgi:nitrogen regulatory protein PII|nr:P-II family nitrogen regulator [Nitrososphaeraceae archaeon]